jgi:L-lactate dehydrogenase complex protein LldG
MMTIRDEILSRLKRDPQKMPVPGTYKRSYPDLAAQFSLRLQASAGEVYRVFSLDEGLEKLGELFRKLKVKTVAAQRETPLDRIDFPASFPDQTWHFAGEVEGYREVCAEADAGLTSAVFALAETGTLVLEPGPVQSRLTSLLPPVHFVLLPESRILPSIFDWSAQLPDPLPSNVVLVSGPSKTADIEQTLVVGVHGPKRLIVIVYPE